MSQAPVTVLLFSTPTTTLSKLAGALTGYSKFLQWLTGECVSLPDNPMFSFSVGLYSNVKLCNEAEYSTMLVLASISSPAVVNIKLAENCFTIPDIVASPPPLATRKPRKPISYPSVCPTLFELQPSVSVQSTSPKQNGATNPNSRDMPPPVSTKKPRQPISYPSECPTLFEYQPEVSVQSLSARQNCPPPVNHNPNIHDPNQKNHTHTNNLEPANSIHKESSTANSVTRSARLPNIQPPTLFDEQLSASGNSRIQKPYTYNPEWESDTDELYSDGNYGSHIVGSQSNSGAGYDWQSLPSEETDSASSKLNKKRTCQKNNKKRLKSIRNSGEWYPGATTDIPTFDISQKHRDINLMSNGWSTCIKGVGQEFKGGAVEFRLELVKYASHLGFHYKFKRNDAIYVTAQCKHMDTDGCQWFVRGAVHRVTKSLFIKAANLQHTCRFSIMRYDTKRMGSRVIGQILQEQIRENPTLKPKKLQQQLAKTHGFHLECMPVWRGVEQARAHIFGCYKESFDELRWYSYAIERRMPGSITVLEPDIDTNQFKRYFFALKPSLEGFKFCRPMLFIDGTFMKNRHKGTVLTATAKDGNNGLFPVAIAIVSSENTENWVWFIKLVMKHVTHSHQIIYVSDRAGGILAAFDLISQKPYHFYCLWHLMKNLRDRYGNKSYTEKHRNVMCMLLKNLAYAPNLRLFDEAMIPFINVGGEIARNFLKDLPRDRWAVAYSPDLLRYGELTSSAAESFNSRIYEARSLNINHMVDAIRSILTEWFVDRVKEAGTHPSALTPAKEEAWNANDSLSATWGIQMTNEEGSMFHVLSIPSAVVDLKAKTCSCWNWQITGFPCSHVVVVITRGRMDIRAFIEPYFFTETWRKVYSIPIQPIPTTDKFEYPNLQNETKIEPPDTLAVPGRPQIKRFKKGRKPKAKKFKCDTCGKLGRHNWATCMETMQQPVPSNPYSYNPINQTEQPTASAP